MSRSFADPSRRLLPLPAQVLAYHLSVARGIDPDFPRNLAAEELIARAGRGLFAIRPLKRAYQRVAGSALSRVAGWRRAWLRALRRARRGAAPPAEER